jgi:hypothetical protein
MINSEGAFYNDALQITKCTVGEISPYHTASGVHVVQVVIAHAMGDFVSMNQAIGEFVRASQRPCHSVDLTLGISGTLMGCSIILECLLKAPAVTGSEYERRDQVLGLGNATMERIWARLCACAPISECADPEHTGIAHGWAGMCYATLLWCKVSGASPPAYTESRVGQLAEIAEPYGRGVRWPVRLRGHRPRDAGNYMESWCNGAPGQLHLWTLAYPVLP